MKHRKLILKTLVYCIAGLAVFLAFSLLWHGLVGFLARGVGIPDDYVVYISMLLLPLLIALPKRYLRIKLPRKITGETVIAAPIAVVWDAVCPRPRQDTFKRFYAEIRAVKGREDVFEYVPEPVITDDDPSVTPLIVAVAENEPPHKLSLYHENSEDQGGLGVGASMETYRLEEVPEGTRVRFQEVVEYTSFWLVLTLILVSPAKDMLQSLKDYCEGGEDTSWMAQRMYEEKTGLDAGTEETTLVVALTIGAFATLVGAGVIWAIFMQPG